MLILEKENIPLSCTKESNQNNQNPLLFDVYLNFVSRDSFGQEGYRSRATSMRKLLSYAHKENHKTIGVISESGPN